MNEEGKPRHYVVVVHGIGEHKINQTATEVIQRFAEVRQEKPPGHYRNLLPSYLSAQSVRRGGTGHGWSEFDGIPVEPPPPGKKPAMRFDGQPPENPAGISFRFVDLDWEHILRVHQKRYASPVDEWATALLERLDVQEKQGNVPQGWIEPWVRPLLKRLVDTLLPMSRLLRLRSPELAERIFDNYLGDVHLYGDYARTRGRAVRHFHNLLDEIHLRDFIDWCKYYESAYQPPIYTVIAHSLGSVLSFDALVYAHAKKNVRDPGSSKNYNCPSLPFPGYTFDRKEEAKTWNYLVRRVVDTGRSQELLESLRSISDHEAREHLEQQLREKREQSAELTYAVPLLLWRKHMRNFVTLGSPIDKYHVLWHQNYLHMGLKTAEGAYVRPWWAQGGQPDDWLDEPKRKIIHYNLCDEQDPVGHHLDVTRRSANYEKVFEQSSHPDWRGRDVVFRRYAVPGVAHVNYWEDKALFEGILEVIDATKDGEHYFLSDKFRADEKSVYKKALSWAYFRIPFVVAILTGLLLSYGYLGLSSSDFRIDYLAAILAAILLWVRPKPTKAYGDEAHPERHKKTSPLKKWKPQPSVFPHLLSALLEWRRILTDKSVNRLTFEVWRFRLRLLRRFIIGLAVLGLSIVAAWYPEWFVQGLSARLETSTRAVSYLERVAISLFILSATYLGTMSYVASVYFVRRRKQGRNDDVGKEEAKKK